MGACTQLIPLSHTHTQTAIQLVWNHIDTYTRQTFCYLINFFLCKLCWTFFHTLYFLILHEWQEEWLTFYRHLSNSCVPYKNVWSLFMLESNLLYDGWRPHLVLLPQTVRERGWSGANLEALLTFSPCPYKNIVNLTLFPEMSSYYSNFGKSDTKIRLFIGCWQQCVRQCWTKMLFSLEAVTKE